LLVKWQFQVQDNLAAKSSIPSAIPTDGRMSVQKRQTTATKANI
jgi:hypothetical protein